MDRSLQHAFDAEEVMAYLDGELEPQRAVALAGHLEYCAECQGVAKELRLVSARMLSFEVEPAPANLASSVLANLNSSGTQKPTKVPGLGHRIWTRSHELLTNRRVWAPAAGLAALVAAVVLASGPHWLRSRQGMNLAARSASEPYLAPPRPGPPVNGYPLQLQGSPAGRQQSREAFIKDKALSAVSSSVDSSDSTPPSLPPSSADDERLHAPDPVGPMIAQTASLTIVAKNYTQASAEIEELAKGRGGYVEKLDAKAQAGNARELSLGLRIPANHLDGFLADLRQLGHVEQESQSNEEVSAEYVDLQARLRSAQATERRLIELLDTRTGKLEDVLDAERELARVRGEIESMQGQSAVLAHRVSYATVQVELSEEYQEKLQSDSLTSTRLRNALVEGLKNLGDGIVGVLIFLLNYGPAILFWVLVISVPWWFVWRRFQASRKAPG